MGSYSSFKTTHSGSEMELHALLSRHFDDMT
jgi:hypothetical protein